MRRFDGEMYLALSIVLLAGFGAGMLILVGVRVATCGM